MDQQELKKLLEEQLECVLHIRQVQVQYLAESDRSAEQKRHARNLADQAWKRYNEIYNNLTAVLAQEI